MIYVVSNTINPSGWGGIESLSVEQAKNMILSWPVVQFDSETPGIDCHCFNYMLSLQFGYKDFKTGECNQIVVDAKSIDPLKFKDVLEQSYLIGHNLKFDLKWLYNYGIVPRKVYDTMICEQVLYLGYSRKQITYNLHDVLNRYTGIELDKSMQKEIAQIGLTEEGIRYAAGDVIYLQDIRKGQMLTAQERNCLNAFTVENRFVPAIAYLEWCGIHLDEKKWRAKMTVDEKHLKESLDSLNEFVLSNPNLSEFVSTSSDSISDDSNGATLFTFEPKCIIDWNSPQQVAPVFKKLGFDISVFDKDSGKDKESVSEKVLEFQTGINDDFLNSYLDYKGYYKSVSSYGQGHLNQINPFTNRIHTEFRQIGTVTGRMASGSTKANKDLAKVKKLHPPNVTYCNLQNLPARGETGGITRACFTASEGNKFISCDYSAEELTNLIRYNN